ncbi:RNA-directed DNA polymerase, eukaryota, reverse transcriptase zinc-binding domain protein [Tanacetum coccineum]
MRTKRQQKVPQKLEDYVLNTNNCKNNNKKTVSKKNPDELNQFVNTEMNKGTKQGGSDVVNYDKEVKDEVNSVVNDKVADCSLEDELGSFDDGIGLDKEESFPSLNSSIKKANNECPENNRTDERRHNEELVEEGSKKWKLTLCGYFVGYKMSYMELRYNLFKMWGKYVLKEIISQNGMFLFKFKHEEGMESILETGPLMVNNKPLLIQK